MIRSYIYFALTLGLVVVVFLMIALDIDTQTIELRLPTLLLVLGLFGMSIYIFSQLMVKRITRPLEHIAEAIERMGKGEYKERLSITADYEFSVIQHRFNEMAESLEQAERENRRLQDSKQRMLADLSHDLKTPVTTIQGYAKALQLGLVDSQEKKERYLQLIYNKATVVTALIDDLFRLSKLERPDYPISVEQGDLAELLREIAADYYDAMEDKGMVMELDIPSGEVMADYDPGLMRRAIANLLSNAVQHNSGGTVVLIALEELAEDVRIRVQDNGGGISDELKEVIFDPFVRGDAARPGDGGTGLGLAISKQILELHRGELRLDNRNGLTVFELVVRKKPGTGESAAGHE
ncbi:HAMP domain-containing sensor histidine kinase [Paenibacillus sonchi]|uniref:HAMP domain-containing sensor histidine kinase n=1 Tax=Paenibacillus sonchi TaxID=373687 RepID=UPI001E3495FB|nr:HAMP domain-containing sensor histidine kinase [Paenibacillus sonchi]